MVIEKLKAWLRYDSNKRQITEEIDTALDWVVNGETGISSLVIFAVMMTGKAPKIGYWQCPPLDPADFRRCRILLDRIPGWRKRLPEIARLIPEWQPMVEHWDELDALYDEECGQSHAPKLYRRLQELWRVPAMRL